MDVITFQGLYPHCGVTSVAVSLAWSMADSSDISGKVLLLDAAGGRRCLARQIGLDSGICDWRGDGDSLVQALMNAYHYDEKLFVLPVSPETQETAFSSSAADKLLEELKNAGFEVVIADAGTRESDPARCFAQKSLMTVTVVPADTTAAEDLENLTPADNEYILFNLRDSRSRLVTQFLENLRKNSESKLRILDAVIPLDEFVREASLKRQPYTMYLNHSEAGFQTERLILDYSIVKNRGGEDTSADSEGSNAAF